MVLMSDRNERINSWCLDWYQQLISGMGILCMVLVWLISMACKLFPQKHLNFIDMIM